MDVEPLVALLLVDQPLNILFPLVMLQLLLSHVGRDLVLPVVHVVLPFVVPLWPPQVPVPPFLFSVIVFVVAVHVPEMRVPALVQPVLHVNCG